MTEKNIMKILLVDDDDSLLLLIKRFLEKKGHSVFAALSGKDALLKVKKSGFDLVLLDINMFGLNGIETLKKIREFDQTTMVIMLTGAHSEKIAKKCFELGANNFLTKPFNEEEFKTAVEMARFLKKQ